MIHDIDLILIHFLKLYLRLNLERYSFYKKITDK